MKIQKTVREISDGIFFIGIQPPLANKILEELQTEVLEQIRVIGQFAVASKITQKKGVSCFRISTSHPWPGFKKALELGLDKGLDVLNKAQERRGR